ncbi:P-loop containing nucleoside triphosphate hydrolase protein [Amanita muscaria]
MPSPRYTKVLLSFLFTECVEDEDGPRYLYDDEQINENLGIKRVLPGNMSQLNLPHSIKSQDVESFKQFLDVAKKMTPKQMKDSATTIGSPAQWSAWHRFALATISPKMNRLIEDSMIETQRHPINFMEGAKSDDWSRNWSTSHSGYIANTLGMSLLGYERMMSSFGQSVLADLSLMVTYNYDRLRKCHMRLGKRLDDVLAELEKATAALLDDNIVLTTPQIRAAAIAIRKYQKATAIHAMARSKADPAEGALAGVMAQFGIEEKELKYNKSNKSAVEKAHEKGKQKKMHPADLADKESVRQIINLYLDFFQRDDGELHLEGETAGQLWLEACDQSGDLGVHDMSKKSEAELSTLLSFPNGRPLAWNNFSAEGKASTAWEETDADMIKRYEEGGSPDMKPLYLLWHQLVGVASMAEKTWRANNAETPFGILLADEVGVGKTAQVMAFIAFLQFVQQSEVKGSSRPTLLADKPFFMGTAGVPNAPHAIIVPNTLINQWRRELKCFFKPHAIDIFVLPTARAALKDYFEDSSSPWKKSNHELVFRVVLVPHSVFNTLTGMSFLCDRRKPLDARRELTNTAPGFFKMDWCSSWIDEAHQFRTPTRSFIGAIQLRNRARIMCCCTATPLFTKPQDVVNLGRIIGVPNFIGERGYDWERDNSRAWTRAQRGLTKDDKLEIRKALENTLLGKDAELPTASNQVQALKLRYIKDIQSQFRDHIIRRTKESKRPDGNNINELPPLTSLILPVTLTHWELDILNQALGDVLHSRRNTSLVDINSEASHPSKFYIHYRLNIAYPLGSTEDEKKKFPEFSTREQWLEKPGSKLRILIRLLQHLLQDDEIGHASVEGSEVIFPPAPQVDGREPNRSRKILIYYEYPMTTPPIVSAMRVNGIIPYVINGSMKVKERDEEVQNFVSGIEPNRRVLLFSSVGAAGLNLACADVVILYDMVWSDQATIQIIGRAHRLGQEKPVHVYHLLAVGTTDVIISSMAREKNDMLKALLTRTIKEAPALEEFFNGDPNSDDENEDVIEEDDETTKRGKKRAPAKKPRQKKGKGSSSAGPSETTASSSQQPHPDGQASSSSSPSKTTAPSSQQPPTDGQAASSSGQTQPAQTTSTSPNQTVAGGKPSSSSGVTRPSETPVTSTRLEENQGLPEEVPGQGGDITSNASSPLGTLTPLPPSEDERFRDDQANLANLVASTSISKESDQSKKRTLNSPNSDRTPKCRQQLHGDDDDDHNPHINLATSSRQPRRKPAGRNTRR